MNLWDRYVLALGAYQRHPTALTRRALGIAYSDWVGDFCPSMADQLIAEYAARLNQNMAGKAA